MAIKRGPKKIKSVRQSKIAEIDDRITEDKYGSYTHLEDIESGKISDLYKYEDEGGYREKFRQNIGTPKEEMEFTDQTGQLDAKVMEVGGEGSGQYGYGEKNPLYAGESEDLSNITYKGSTTDPNRPSDISDVVFKDFEKGGIAEDKKLAFKNKLKSKISSAQEKAKTAQKKAIKEKRHDLEFAKKHDEVISTYLKYQEGGKIPTFDARSRSKKTNI